MARGASASHHLWSPAAPLAGGALAFMDALADAFELTRALVALETPTGSEGPATDLLDGTLSPRGLPHGAAAGLARARQPARLPRAARAGVLDPRGLRAAVRPAVRGRGGDPRPRQLRRQGPRRRHGGGGGAAGGAAASGGSACCSSSARRTAPTAPAWPPAWSRAGRFLINGEPTENRLSIGQKGSLRVDLQATGRAAHSAYPEEGESAVAALLDTIERIRPMPLPRDPLLGPSTLNVGLIRGRGRARTCWRPRPARRS